VSCESKIKDQTGSTDLLSSYKIGETHNELLEYLYGKSGAIASTQEILKCFEYYMVNVKGYEHYQISQKISEIKKTSEFERLDMAKSNFLYSDINQFLSEVELQLNPSREFVRCIKNTILLGETNSPDEVKLFVEKNFQNKNWRGVDKQLAYIFSDVFNSSYNFWMLYWNEEKELKKSSKVILYDAAGAIHGFIFGPIGSIIEGALVSVAANERLPE